MNNEEFAILKVSLQSRIDNVQIFKGGIHEDSRMLLRK